MAYKIPHIINEQLQLDLLPDPDSQSMISCVFSCLMLPCFVLALEEYIHSDQDSRIHTLNSLWTIFSMGRAATGNGDHLAVAFFSCDHVTFLAVMWSILFVN